MVRVGTAHRQLLADCARGMTSSRRWNIMVITTNGASADSSRAAAFTQVDAATDASPAPSAFGERVVPESPR